MKTYHCPNCFSQKLDYNEDTDYVTCRKCEEFYNTDEIQVQPKYVPYKYHTINSGVFGELTQDEHNQQEVRYDF